MRRHDVIADYAAGLVRPRNGELLRLRKSQKRQLKNIARRIRSARGAVVNPPIHQMKTQDGIMLLVAAP